MTTSRTSTLSKPSDDDRVPLGTFGYFRARNKHRLYTFVIAEFHKSGITQATLARRLGKGTDQVCRLLGAPGNWTSDTVSDLLFAISGAAPQYKIEYPLDAGARNSNSPDWLNDDAKLANVAQHAKVAISDAQGTTPKPALVPPPAPPPAASGDATAQMIQAGR